MNLRGSIIAAALKQIMERDGLGTLEQHAPLTTKFYNPKSRQYDEDVHKKHALPSFGGQAGDLPKQGPAQETQAEQAIEKRLDQMFTVLMALDKRLKIVEENMD
ncbi:hypothetical protein F66182_17445 [Fusarium sp. NRRL 66182]|nr:hypothetical protein F66182_17445 [Fusarium sp. NRRL 66182]